MQALPTQVCAEICEAMLQRSGGQTAVKTTLRSFVSLLILLVGYESMVGAFHLLNKPSDRAVYEGTVVLVLLVTLVPFALYRLWRSS